jgi:hypothetical protein
MLRIFEEIKKSIGGTFLKDIELCPLQGFNPTDGGVLFPYGINTLKTKNLTPECIQIIAAWDWEHLCSGIYSRIDTGEKYRQGNFEYRLQGHVLKTRDKDLNIFYAHKIRRFVLSTADSMLNSEAFTNRFIGRLKLYGRPAADREVILNILEEKAKIEYAEYWTEAYEAKLLKILLT